MSRYASFFYIKLTRYLNFDKLVKSPFSLSFRVKREILVLTTGEILLQPIEKIRFLPVVEMTHSMNPTFYEFINFACNFYYNL